MNDFVKIERNGAVMSITLNRPDKKNALTGAMYETLIEAFNEADTDSSIGAIVIAGSGGCFTAGNDIGDFLSNAGSEMDQFPALKFIRRLAILDTPIVAAVQGVAVGVGTTMIFHCDLVYATPSAMFRMPFVDLGLVPEAGSSFFVPQLFGLQKAGELLLLGDAFNAEEGHRLGVVNAIVGDHELHGFAMERAHRLAAKPRNALATTRRLIRGDRDALLARIDEEARLFGRAMRSPEAQNAFAAFMQKGKSK
jgi:enoyl-CoA hydratase/carnithine racemase